MQVTSRTRTVLSPWVTVVERGVEVPGTPEIQMYHSLEQADYVTILSVTADNQIPMVRQFRPALERETLELPGGLLEVGTPEDTARNELFEETGYRTSGPLIPLGCLHPDSGRLENRFWGFFAAGVVRESGWRAEEGVDPVLVPPAQLKADIISGEFSLALHIALVGLAVMKGLI
jgi:ADP-ribose pyrophosphatase